MGRRKSPERDKIKWMLTAGIKNKDIAQALSVSEGFVHKVNRETQMPTGRVCQICGAPVPGHLHFLCERCYKKDFSEVLYRVMI